MKSFTELKVESDIVRLLDQVRIKDRTGRVNETDSALLRRLIRKELTRMRRPYLDSRPLLTIGP